MVDTEHDLAAAPLHVRRVVVGYDGSGPGTAALEAGARRAHRDRVPLLVVCAVDLGDPVSVAPFLQSAEASLDAAAERCRTDHAVAQVSTQVAYGSASHALLDVSRPGDLLVVGTHGHRALARALLGSTSTAVATKSRHPVLVVRTPATEPARATASAGTRPRVVVGIDGSPSSVAALGAAAAEADRAEAVLLAVTAVSPIIDAAGFVRGPDATELRDAEVAQSEALAGLHERYPDLEVERLVSHCDPVEALVHASATALLVVVGSRGQGVLWSVVLGSVGRGVVQRAGCSVLVVRPDSGPASTSVSAGRVAAGR